LTLLELLPLTRDDWDRFIRSRLRAIPADAGRPGRNRVDDVYRPGFIRL